MSTPLVEVRQLCKRFGGVLAVDHADCDLYEGECVGLLGHNGAGKSTLIKVLSGAYESDGGTIKVRGQEVHFHSPRDARAAGIETIHQTLALADNLDAPGNLFLGRELLTRLGTLDAHRMEYETRQVIARLNPNFKNILDPVLRMSGGQRQTVAIARALYFNARILIMDEPCAALGPAETRMVLDTIRRLKEQGIGIFLISHDMHDVFEVCDRATVMKNGAVVGTVRPAEVSQDDVLQMIILGTAPARKAA
ncbi:MAG TPA: ATP-binding cassette domain-containing protein [Burkholderiaceae bacterium]|nr:ATP-binding cassette domain-containing protein [Burkholderiaceae bacterium]